MNSMDSVNHSGAGVNNGTEQVPHLPRTRSCGWSPHGVSRVDVSCLLESETFDTSEPNFSGGKESGRSRVYLMTKHGVIRAIPKAKSTGCLVFTHKHAGNSWPMAK